MRDADDVRGDDDTAVDVRWTTADRRALWAVGTLFFVNGAVLASYLARMPEIRDRVGISVAGVGLLASAAGLFGLAGSALVSPVMARWGTRAVVIVTGLLLSATLVVVGAATEPVLLFVGLAAATFFDVFVDVGMNMQGSWLSGRRHAPVMNRLHGLWSLGTVAGGLAASGLAAAEVPLPVHLGASALVLVLVVAGAAPFLLDHDEHPAPESEPSGATETNGSAVWVVLTLFALAGFFAVAVESTALEWSTFRLTDDMGQPSGTAALAFVAVTSGMTIGRFGGDWAIVRLGRPRLLLTASAVAAVGVLATLPNLPLVAIAGFAVVGLGMATMLPTVYDEAVQYPGRPAAGLGALSAGIRAAILSVPLLVGLLADSRLSVGVAIAVVALPAIAGFAVTTAALERTADPQPAPRS